MRLFGVVITTREAIMRDRMENAAQDATFQLRTLLKDREHPLRGAIIRVARSAAKDYLAEEAEAGRARFEADPEFQTWAGQRRETALAEQLAAKQAELAALAAAPMVERVPQQLRFGVLGLLMEHGVQFLASVEDAFDGWSTQEVKEALDGLVSDALVEERRGVYISAWRTGVGFPEKKEDARNEDSDSQ